MKTQAFAVLFLASYTSAATADGSVPEYRLKALTGTVEPGIRPRFRLTISNPCIREVTALSPERIAVLPYTLVVWQAGKQVSLGGAIADPIAPGPTDYLHLMPGESRSFVLSWFREALDELPVGTYQVRALCARYPEEAVLSSEATFHVRRRGAS
jgi:hypothetical protein